MIPGGAQGLFPLLQHGVCSAVMDVIGGEHGDSAMAVLGVVPREERPAEGDSGVDIVELPGEAGVVLQGLELGLGEGVVIADVGAAQRASHPEVGEELGGAFAGHGRPAVGVQCEDLGLDALLEASLLDQRCGEGGVLALGDHPAERVAAEDVEQDVEVEVAPACRSQQSSDIPGPRLVRPGGHQLGLGVGRMFELIAPLSHRLICGQDPIHRALRAQVSAFIEQRGDDLGGRAVDEARGGEHVEHLLAFGVAQRPGGRGDGAAGARE